MKTEYPTLPRKQQWQTNQKTIVWFALVYIFLFALAQIPIWFNEFLPLQDYPNHLARMYVILHGQNDPSLQEYYRVNFTVLPNLAMDIIVPILAMFVGLQIAGKLTVVLIIFMLTGGSIFLSYVIFNRLNFWSLTTFMVVYNQAFIIGFINFLLGIGLALWVLGLWILMRHNKPWLRLVLFSFLTTALFICHLYAFGFYGIAVVSYEAYLFFKQRSYFTEARLIKLAVIFGQFAIPIALYLFSPTSSGESEIVEATTYFTPLLTKFRFVKMRMTDNYSSFLDLITVIFLAFLPVIGLGLKKLRINQYMIFPIAIVTVVYFVMPQKFITTSHADWRILVPLFLLFLSSIEFKFDKLFNRVILASYIAFFALRIFVINTEWHGLQSEFKEIYSAIAHVEQGSRLFSARAYTNYYETTPFMHAPTYAVIERSAFVPSLFAFETQQPVQFKSQYINVVADTLVTNYARGKGVDWKDVLKFYDYVMLSGENLFDTLPKSKLSRVFKGKYVNLYKVKQ
jgi:hypothetical protein